MWKRLKAYFLSADTKMTRSRYLSMCEQLGVPPKVEEIPADWDDLPEIAQLAINMFNQLGDRIYPEIGYIGKDYSNLDLLISLNEIIDKELLLDILLWLDNRAIKQSSEKLKREYDKIKNRKK